MLKITDEEMVQRLKKPSGKVDVVLDTDTYNEIDDQFALSYLLANPDRLNLKAIYAAPFFNQHSVSPADGMEKSYDEIRKILELNEKGSLMDIAFKGSEHYLKDEKTGVPSPAASDLAKRAENYSAEKPLYVIAIGAITNIASAILLNPSIVEKIVVVWLGGHGHDWTDDKEFNMMQDVAAARVVFNSNVPLVRLPCMGIVSEFRTTEPELTHWLKGKNKLCDYLLENTVKEAKVCEQSKCWSRAIWDVTAVAWLLDDSFMESRIERRQEPGYDHHPLESTDGAYCIYVYHINRDALFEDMFDKLSKSVSS